MPNRYEREIEEILRNLEHTDSRSGPRQKSSARQTRRPDPQTRPRQPRLSLHLSWTDRLFLGTVLIALIAGGYAYISRPDIVSLVLTCIAVLCLILVACSQFLLQPRRSSSVQYGNVTITPIHQRNPFQSFKTRWNLFKLKMRYNKKNVK